MLLSAVDNKLLASLLLLLLLLSYFSEKASQASHGPTASNAKIMKAAAMLVITTQQWKLKRRCAPPLDIQALESFKNRLCEGIVVHPYMLHDSILNHKREPLRAHASQLRRGIKLHSNCFGELAVGVRQNPHLAVTALILAPRCHHEGVIHTVNRQYISTRS
eukprot:TRINITY_DN30646_c0_g1_i1.p1 TRINITY_DN30646_c0_g1~~TRINITY_DN30646_c0_g1_i1.p1  ORF type:complete len:162 (+),score=10.98 TRINITY_DN30646_c0_g1_i1:17-502(+)